MSDLKYEYKYDNIFEPTLFFRWYETIIYNPVSDDFDKILQQKWISLTGKEEWRDVETYRD